MVRLAAFFLWRLTPFFLLALFLLVLVVWFIFQVLVDGDFSGLFIFGKVLVIVTLHFKQVKHITLVTAQVYFIYYV